MYRRRMRGGSVEPVFLVLILIATLSGCIARSAPAGATFSADGFRFDYPRTWNSGRFEQRSPIVFRSLTYLSNQPFDVVCTRSSPRPGVTEYGCTPPIPTLHAGGLVIHWLQFPADGDPLSDVPGRVTTLAGHPARVSRSTTSQDCAPGTRQSIQATIGSIPKVDGGGSVLMTACLTRRDQVVQVMAMLGSLRIDG